MSIKAITLACVATLSLAVAAASAEVGYNKIDVPASSDAFVLVPFSQTPVELAGQSEFEVTGKTATGVTVAGTPFTGSYTDTHYVRVVDGNGEGLWATVTAQSTSSLDLSAANGDVLAEINVGDTFRLYPHYTINDLFDPKFAGLLFPTSNVQILLFDNDPNALPSNPSASAISSFDGSNWVGAADGTTVLEPETQFIFRNTSGSAAQVITLGQVPDFNPSFLIGADGDMTVGTGLPVQIALGDAGLGGTDSRQILFFAPNAGVNSSAIGVSSFDGGSGSWVGGSGFDGTRLISGSEAFLFRLPAGETATRVTINNPLAD